MLHYELVKKRGCPLYECLYECLREDILRGRLLPGTKLPSRRELCIFRKNCASVPEERSAIPLQTEQSSAG